MSKLYRISILEQHMIAFSQETSARNAINQLSSEGFECDVLQPEVKDAEEHGGYYSDEWIVVAARRYIAPDILNIDQGRADEKIAVRQVTDGLGGRYEGSSINLGNMEDVKGD